MCRKVTCSTCGKATYAGCGAHVEQVLAGVANDQRCRCREAAPPQGSATASKGQDRRKWWPWG
jgi:hypothetical protein